MTTTVSTKFQGSSPRRLRHIAITVLAGAALLTSTGWVVNRIVDSSSPGAVQVLNAPPVSAAVVPAPERSSGEATPICGGEFGWVCAAAEAFRAAGGS